MDDKPEHKPEKPQFEIIERALMAMLYILGLVYLVPQFIAAYHHENVAFSAMILELEINDQYWMILSALVAALGVKHIGKNKP